MKILLIVTSFFLASNAFCQRKTYTIVFLNKKPDAETIDKSTQDKLMEGHMANINRLAKEGKLLAAGPFDGGGGLFIFNTASQKEAEEWVASDPAVQARRWDIELLPYAPRQGSICPVSEPYQMVQYSFARFSPILDKSAASNYARMINKHDDFIRDISKRLSIVTEAVLDGNLGGILIVKDELAPSTFHADPAVQQGLLSVKIKKLYIAKGSFCEL